VGGDLLVNVGEQAQAASWMAADPEGDRMRGTSGSVRKRFRLASIVVVAVTMCALVTGPSPAHAAGDHVVGLAPTTALADGTLDQSQPSFSNGAAGTCEDERLAQIVTGGLTGGLDRVDLHLWRDDSNTSADLQVQIQTTSIGLPTGTVLASATVPLEDIVTNSQTTDFVTATFDPPAEVRAGQQYAIVVLQSGLPCTQGYWWSFVDGLAYPSGDGLSNSTGNWIPFGGDNGVDFAFKTYVDTTVPTVDISDRDSRIRPDGSVPVSVFARCQPGQQAFELDVSVRQGAASGSTTLLGPGITPCDGTSHRIRVLVSPDVGAFAAGAIDIEAFLGVFDPVEGDLDATDTATVQLLEPFSCRVWNSTQHAWFASVDGSALTDAISAAAAGDRLTVFGTCFGNYTIDRDLTVSGSWSSATPATISGAGLGRTLLIQPDVTVTLSHLTITGGNVNTPGGGGGLFVNDGAKVLLYRSTVIANSTSLVGGGIVNGGALAVIRSSVEQNYAVGDGDGGGIYNYGQLVVIGSRLWNNLAGGVGGGLFNESSAILRWSSVRFNRASGAGGILNVGLLTLDHTVVSTNSPNNCEGC
jgi:hypothetical protein